MAAVLGGDEAAVRALCDDAREGDALAPANFNAPGQIVIAGHASSVARARELAAARKLKAIPLNVSAPFHCSLMEPAARAVEKALSSVEVRPLAFPVVPNVEALPNQDPKRVPDLLVRQVDGAVLWDRTVQFLSGQGVRLALEIGPGKVLAGLVRKIDKQLAVHGVSDPEGVGKASEFLSTR
jgi:[acyl-carrier-protein] S-malonyltransferase